MRGIQVSLALVIGLSVIAVGCGKSGDGDEEKSALDKRKETLSKVGQAMYDHTKAHEGIFFPSHNSNGLPPNRGAKRKEGLSWRVYILPTLGYKELYDQFKLDEPWDSPNNKKLLEKMPAEYKTHGVSEPGKTALHVFIEPPPKGSIMGGGRVPFSRFVDKGFVGPMMRMITDGTPNTLMFVEAGADKAEPWTKPTALMFDDKGTSVETLGKTDEEGFLFVYFNGTVGRIKKSVKPEHLRRLLRHTDSRFTKQKDDELPGVERLE